VQVELKKAQTTAQQIDIFALWRTLNLSIRRFRTLQATYTPTSIIALGQRENIPENKHPEDVLLFLPSALTPEQWAHEPLKGLAVIEDSLWDAQCSTSLVLLRNQLHIKSRLLTYKHIQLWHQGANT
jgi:hypothetical protein